MGVLFDILKLADATDISDGINVLNDVRKSNKRRYSSITHQATEGTLQFPVLVSTSMDIETLQMITKALEREYSSVVQTVMSLSPIMDLDKNPNGPIDYIHQFHQNEGVKSNNSLANLLLRSDLDEGYTSLDCGDIELSYKVYETSYAPLVNSNKDQLVDLMKELRHDILNNKYVPSKESLFNFKDPALNAKYNNILFEKSVISEHDPAYDMPMGTPEYLDARDEWLNKPIKKGTKESTTTEHDPAYDMPMGTPEYLDARDGWLDEVKFESTILTEADKPRSPKSGGGPDKVIWHDHEHHYSGSATINQVRSGGFTDTTHQYKYEDPTKEKNFFKDVLVDNDVRKANELVPTLLHIRLKVKSNGEVKDAVDFIIGIKAIMHPIKSEEFVTNIVEACNNNDKVFNFLRWTSGEISFFKDFLFSIKTVKNDVKRINGGYSTWWNALKRRRQLSKITNVVSYTNNNVLPNSTLVISIDEANYIKSNYGFDLFKPVFVDRIMKELFLLGFVIVDESSQVAHFKFDGQKHYQSVSFSGLEKENTSDARKFKEMLKVINRM